MTLAWHRAVLIGALVSVGCALGGRLSFREPTVTLETVEIVGIGFTGGSLNVRLDVHNPNRYEIRAIRMTAGLDLEDTHFGDAAIDRDVILPAETNTAVDIPVTFTWQGVGAGARALLQRGTVGYALDSRITVATPVGERTFEFRDGGEVPLKEFIR